MQAPNEKDDIVARITKRVNNFQRSKVQIPKQAEIVEPVARVGDTIQHSSFLASLAGVVVGAMVSAAPYLLCGLLGPLGVAARVGVMIFDVVAPQLAEDKEPSWAEKAKQATTNFLNDCFSSPDGVIIKGDNQVLVNGKPIAVAQLAEAVACQKHGNKMIAEGSETVSVNQLPVARKGDQTQCGAKISSGSENVFFGSGRTQVVDIDEEFSLAQRVFLIGVEMGFPPSSRTMKQGLGKIRLGISGKANNKIRKEVVSSDPPFKLSKKHKSPELKREFERQLQDQQDAINKMSVKEWLKNVEYNRANRYEYNKLSAKMRNKYKNSIKHELEIKLKREGFTQKEINLKVKNYMKDKAVLHSPDGIAGGKYDSITGLGNRRVNSSIGSQWKSRIGGIEDKIKRQYGIPPKSIDDIANHAMMNIKLL